MIKLFVVFGICVIAFAVMDMIIIVLTHDRKQEDRKKGDDTHDHTR